MPEYAITTTPEDPSLDPVWVGGAETPLAALDSYAHAEGFALYSSLLADPEHAGENWVTFYDPPRADGCLASAVFTNYELFVFAVPS